VQKKRRRRRSPDIGLAVAERSEVVRHGDRTRGIEMKSGSQRIFGAIVDAAIRRPSWFLGGAFVLTILAVFVIATKFDIRSDLKDLMPADAQSVVDTFKISERMGSIQTLQVIVESPALNSITEAQRASADYEACRLEIVEMGRLFMKTPPVGESWCDNTLVLFGHRFVREIRDLDSVGNVGFINDKSFFERNLLLYASAEELEEAYDALDRVLTEARRQSGEYKTCLIAESDAEQCAALEPSLERIIRESGVTLFGTPGEVASAEQGAGRLEGLGETGGGEALLREALVLRYEDSELSSVDEIPIERLGDGSWILRLNVRFKDSTTSLRAVQREIERIQALVERLDVSHYDASIKVVYRGGVTEMRSEYDAIVKDLSRSIPTTIISIIVLMALFFRSLRASLRVFVPLLMSTVWALGIAFLTLGYLNIITSFIFAILIGIGIDFGIHLYSRYLKERRLGKTIEVALRISVVETGSPIFFGALTTSAAFFTLTLGSFRGFSQFGFVAGIGVLLAFLTMCVIMPALTIVMERILPSRPPKVMPYVGVSEQATRRAHRAMMIACVLTLGIGGYCAFHLRDIQFEENFYRLRLKMPASDTASADPYAQVSTRPATATIVLFDDIHQVAALDYIIKRNREYRDFQHYRRLMMRMPNAVGFLDHYFGEVLPYTGQTRSLPAYAAFGRLVPDSMYSAVPLFAEYGRQKSLTLQEIRAFAMAYPQMAAHLADVFSPILSDHREYDALLSVVWLQSFLPASVWDDLLPTQRRSQQLNAISEYASIFSYLPGTESQQSARLEVIRRIEERISDRNIRFLPTSEREMISELRPYLVEAPVSIDDLPEWVKIQFKESGLRPGAVRPDSGVDYAFGNIGVIYQATSTYNGFQAHMLVRDVRSLRVGGEPLTASSSAFIYADMLTLVKTEGLQIALLALGLILVIVFIQQRNPVSALVVALPVMVGVCATIGIMTFLNHNLGLFNIVMLPVIMGIGIDGGLYLFQRYQTLGRGSVLEAVREVVGAIFMSSATTMVGFGSMVLSQHAGLNTMGEIAILGIGVCFLASFLIQPGLIVLCEKIGVRGTVPGHVYQGHPYDDAKEGVDEGGKV